MICNDKITKKYDLVAAFFCGLGTLIGYYLFFSYDQILLNVLSQKRISSAIFSMLIILLIAGLYGNTVSIIVKNSLQKALKYKNAGEE